MNTTVTRSMNIGVKDGEIMVGPPHPLPVVNMAVCRCTPCLNKFYEDFWRNITVAETVHRNEGDKYDTGKLRYDLIPVRPLRNLAGVYTMGAVKYGDLNYLKGMKWSRVYAAIMRHLEAWRRGEELDPESGLPHTAHAAWGCFTLQEYAKRSIGEDDRNAIHNTG